MTIFKFMKNETKIISTLQLTGSLRVYIVGSNSIKNNIIIRVIFQKSVCYIANLIKTLTTSFF